METNPRLTIGLVPTMGYLHEGHLSLVRQAKAESDLVVMSIFVNPLQFGPNEDFDRYPRDIERDKRLAAEHGVDFLFVPDQEEMYPEKPLTTVQVGGITEVMCGKMRPGHFTGVATVVTKLFNIIRPTYAYFGLKDAQQVAVLQQMVADLNIPVTIRSCPTVREADGLALSSRNLYLSSEERQQARFIYESLLTGKELIQQGERDPGVIKQKMEALLLTQSLINAEYIEIRTFPGLHELPTLKGVEGKIIIAVAARLGDTRLIDNLIIEMA